MRALWPETFVEESNLTQNIYVLRKELGRDDRGRPYIETIPKRGYRFVADVRESGISSLAVLPFRPLVAGERDEYLEVGIADALIAALAGFSRVPVRSVSAVHKYADRALDPLAAGRELGVTAVLDGTVQKQGDRICVTARLTRTTDATTLWAGRYTEDITDIFAMQDAIAQRIAGALEWKLDANARARLAKRHTDSLDAYQSYLKGRYNWSRSTRDFLWKAIDYFRAAIALDPNYALAYVGVADAYAALDWYGILSTRDANPHSLAAAEKALSIDPDLAEAHSALAVARQNAWDWPGAEAAYRRAIELNPLVAETHQRYGAFLAFMGRSEEALRHLRRAQQLDPVAPAIAAQIGMALYCARRYEEAIAQCETTLEVEPTCDEARIYTALSYAEKGMPEAAIAEYLRITPATSGTPDVRAMLARAHALAGNAPEARAMVAELARSQPVPHFWIAMAHVGLGDHDATMTSLERACDDPDDSLTGVRVAPFFDPIRREPRFIAVLKLMGLAR